MDELISISKCAAAIGVHRSTLAAQVKAKQVRSHRGKVRLSEILEDRAANIDLTRSGRHAGKLDGSNKGGGSGQVDPTDGADPTVSDDGELAVIVDGTAMSYGDARALKEHYLARLRQLEFHERSGQVVAVNTVVEMVTAEYAIIRNRFLGLPSLIAPRLVGRSAEEIRAMVHSEVCSVLGHLSDAKIIAEDATSAGSNGSRH